MFQKNISPPSSRLKCKPSKKPAEPVSLPPALLISSLAYSLTQKMEVINVILSLNYMELQPRRPNSSWSLPWEPQIQHCNVLIAVTFLSKSSLICTHMCAHACMRTHIFNIWASPFNVMISILLWTQEYFLLSCVNVIIIISIPG
jgi:hypothetical protein